MKYGKLFTNFIAKYDYIPSNNTCSKLNYAELRHMAKHMYPDVKDNNMGNPLINYTRMPYKRLKDAVYTSLVVMYNK